MSEWSIPPGLRFEPHYTDQNAPGEGRTHGRRSTYRWHLEQNEEPCAECREAEADYRARYRRMRAT